MFNYIALIASVALATGGAFAIQHNTASLNGNVEQMANVRAGAQIFEEAGEEAGYVKHSIGLQTDADVSVSALEKNLENQHSSLEGRIETNIDLGVGMQ